MGSSRERKHSQFENTKLIHMRIYSRMTVLTCFHAKTRRSARKYLQMARKTKIVNVFFCTNRHMVLDN